MALKRLLQAGDHYLFYYVNRHLQCPLLDRTMPWLTHLGSATFALALSLAAALLGREQTRLAGWQAMMARGAVTW